MSVWQQLDSPQMHRLLAQVGPAGPDPALTLLGIHVKMAGLGMEILTHRTEAVAADIHQHLIEAAVVEELNSTETMVGEESSCSSPHQRTQNPEIEIHLQSRNMQRGTEQRLWRYGLGSLWV